MSKVWSQEYIGSVRRPDVSKKLKKIVVFKFDEDCKYHYATESLLKDLGESLYPFEPFKLSIDMINEWREETADDDLIDYTAISNTSMLPYFMPHWLRNIINSPIVGHEHYWKENGALHKFLLEKFNIFV